MTPAGDVAPGAMTGPAVDEARQRRGRRSRRIAFAGAGASGLLALFLVGSVALRLPPEPPPVDPAGPAGPQVERIERELIAPLPDLARRFAWWPLGLHDDVKRAVLFPDDWQRENTTHEERVARFNANVSLLRARALGVVSLLVTALLLGAAAMTWTALRGASALSLLIPLGACLSVTPVVTEPLVGNDYGADLLAFVLPLLLGGAPLVLLNLGAFLAPASAAADRAGGLLARAPWLASLLGAIAFGAVGGVLIGLGLGEGLDFLLEAGAALCGNALFLLLATPVIAARQLLGRA